MRHIGDEDLILIAYGEETPASRHVNGCPRCRTRVARMSEFLASLEETPVPERDENYGREVWKKLAPRLAQTPVRRPLFGLGSSRNVLRLAAVAALVAVAFLVGRSWPRRPEPLSASVRERILLSAVGDHLERSQTVLLDFVNADPAVDIPEGDRRRAGELAADNRLIRQTASTAGDAAVASVLDDLERVLLELAHGAATADARTALRRRIDSEEVLFKVRVLEARVRAREQAPSAAGKSVTS
jgi:anti-sigma factor RsiW